jgi:hypothetical protein
MKRKEDNKIIIENYVHLILFQKIESGFILDCCSMFFLPYNSILKGMMRRKKRREKREENETAPPYPTS